MTTALNSPVEVGVRVAMILTEAFPESLDINRLVLLDHGILNSADLGGPESLHPPLPARAGGLGVKRTSIEAGLQVMLRAGLVEMAPTPEGIQFRASETSYSFISILSARYAIALRERTKWVVQHFEDLSEGNLRSEMRAIFGRWAEEFAGQQSGTSPSGD